MNRIFNFCKDFPSQGTNTSKSFGPASQYIFRVTTSFTLSAEKKAFTMMRGTLLFQQQVADASKINVILRPTDPGDAKIPVKYIIYRGLKTLDFISSVNLADPANAVLTSGSELLVKMQEIQTLRAPGEAIPLYALFGEELSPSDTTLLDSFFFARVATNSSLFTVDAGTELGNFAIGDAGIEIVLENPEYSPNVEMAKKDFFTLTTFGMTLTSAQQRNYKDKSRHFMDPCAFYGLHSDIPGGIGYRDPSNITQSATTPALVYTHIQDVFATRGRVYLDIRSEHGYSYNYYNNYVGSSGPDVDKELKTGSLPGTLAAKEYYSSGWAMHVVDVITPSTTLDNNHFSLALRVNDNTRPIVASLISTITPVATVSNGVTFIDEQLLVPVPAEFTEPITVQVPNIPGVTGIQPATFVQLHYYKQALPASTSATFPYKKLTDYLFGPLNIYIPFDTQSKIKWMNSYHNRFVDALNDGHVKGEMVVQVQGLNPSLKEISITGDIPVDKEVKVMIANTAGNPQNEGDYSVSTVSFSGGVTKIVVREALPGSVQAGDELKLSVKIAGEFDFTGNQVVIRANNYASLSALGTGKTLDFHTILGYASSYTIANTQFTSPDTFVLLNEDAAKIGLSGLVETGIIVESDADTTVENDEDRLLFYSAPSGYASRDGVRNNGSFLRQGGASNLTSIMQLLEKMNPEVKVLKTNLKISSMIELVSFSFDQKSPAKHVLFLLGIDRQEYMIAMSPFLALIGSGPFTHLFLIQLSGTGSAKNDMNGTPYYEYTIQFSGLDSATAAQVVYDTGIKVYTTDHLFFCSQNFSGHYGLDANDTAWTYEEDKMLNPNYTLWPKNKVLFEKDATVVTKVTEFKDALDALVPGTVTEADVTALLKTKGEELLQHCKQQIKVALQPYSNKDGILYIARLKMQTILRDHPTIASKFPSKKKEFHDTLERYSRGLEGSGQPDFSGVPAGQKKILITGFDPFQGGTDWQGDLSNPSGNIALYMADQQLKDLSGNVKGIVKAAIFPVRWEDFDKGITPGSSKGIAEDFFEPYFTGPNKPDMIITFSYGVHYDNSVDHDFHLERFAANWQSYSSDNNGFYNFDGSERTNTDNANYIKILPRTGPESDWTFIESTLPFLKLQDGSTGKIKVGNYSHTVVNHGPKAGATIYEMPGIFWEIFGTDPFGVEQNLSEDAMSQNFKPALYFPNKPFVMYSDEPTYISALRTDAAFFRGRYLVCDNTDIKYFYPRDHSTNQFYIPLPTWANYALTDPPFNFHTNIRIEARNGSGGTYLSNLIFYRVAYMRMKNGDTIPTGHIHMGFNSDSGGMYDPHGTESQNRIEMLEDVTEMLKRFNDIPY